MNPEIELLGSKCTQCRNPWKLANSRPVCSQCGYRPGIVVGATILRLDQEAKNAGKIPKQAKPTRRKRETKADRVRRRLAHPELFEPTIQPGDTYGATVGNRERDGEALPPSHTPGNRSSTRCNDCDRILIVDNGTVVCPGCGTSYGAVADLNYLYSAFPGIREVAE